VKAKKDALGISVEAKNGEVRALSYLYWGWIRQIAAEEGVVLPKSGSEEDTLSSDQASELAAAIRTRAEKIRKGVAPRDASSYVRLINKEWLEEDEGAATMSADFDDPDSMEKTADFFESSGGVALTY
jgi:hypothetical protein